MFRIIFLLLILLCSMLEASQNAKIDRVVFKNTTNISTNKFQPIIAPFIGVSLDKGNAKAAAHSIELFFRRKGDDLLYARLESVDKKQNTITIKIGRYKDYSQRADCEMKNRKIETGKINRIFFQGNEKISTYRLMHSIQPILGCDNTPENQNKIIKTVNDLYQKHGYRLAYVSLKSADNLNGIMRIYIKKKKY